MPALLRVRRRALAALVAAAVVGGAGGLTFALVTPVTYTASGTLFVSSSGSSAQLLGDQHRYTQQARDSWATLATTPIVLTPVISELQLDMSAAALAKRIQVTSPADTVLLEIGVTDPSARRAARIANAVQDRLVALAPSLTPSTSAAEQPNPLVSLHRAKAVPAGPSALVLALSGALAGLLVWAVVLAVVRIGRLPRPPGGRPAPSMV
jgi:capsular polysaccharide biosynthesis protein